jgi:hypothetical protein
MKTRWFVLLALLAMVVLAGCGTGKSTPAPVATVAPVATEAPVSPAQSYPAPAPAAVPAQSYPGPAAPAAQPYPGPGQAVAASWDEATQLIQGGQVTQIQIQGMQVTLSLKDGRMVTTTQPASDAVTQLIQTCGDPCKAIKVSSQ